tara:strand:+ start:1594 stop:1707 length:114 start_codon:yes stop_codon:yes gene_type:complete
MRKLGLWTRRLLIVLLLLMIFIVFAWVRMAIMKEFGY